MDIIRLKYFIAVTKTLNFTKAAEELFISHSTVSRAVGELEAEFGVQLFDSNNRSVKLTPAGEHLAKRAEELIRLTDELEREMKVFGREQADSFRIATFNFFNNRIFRSIEKFRSKNPAVDVSFLHCDTLHEIVEAVETGEADVGLTFSFTLRDGHPFAVLPIQDGEFVLLVSSANPLASRTSIDIHDPAIEKPILINEIDYPFVRSVGAEALFHDSPGKVMSVNSLNSFFLHIKANLGIGFLPEHLATQVGQGCSILSLDGVDSTYQLVLFYKKGNRSFLLKNLLKEF